MKPVIATKNRFIPYDITLFNSLNSYGGKTSKNFVENNVTLPTSLNILLSKQSKFHFLIK
jgi:hypothetical protein